MKAFISPLYDNETRSKIEEMIKERNPNAVFVNDSSDEGIVLKIMKKSEIALKVSAKCLTVTKLALSHIYRIGIDPFEWCFDSKIRLNLFLSNKTFMFVNIKPERLKELTRKIKAMHGGFSDSPDFYLSEKKIPPKDVPGDSPVVSPDWIDALYTSNNYVDPCDYLFGKRGGTKTKTKKSTGKENAVKTPREVIKEMGIAKQNDAILKMQLKEKTCDINSFFNCEKKETHENKTETKNKKKEEVRKISKVKKAEVVLTAKKPKGSKEAMLSQGNPFLKPNTDTMKIDFFVKKKDNKSNEKPKEEKEKNECEKSEEATKKSPDTNETNVNKPNVIKYLSSSSSDIEINLSLLNSDDETEEINKVAETKKQENKENDSLQLPKPNIIEEQIDSSMSFSESDIENIETEIETEASTKMISRPKPPKRKKLGSDLRPLTLQSLCNKILSTSCKPRINPSFPEGIRPTFEETTKFTQLISQEDNENEDDVFVSGRISESQLPKYSPNHDPLLMELQK